MGITIPRSEAAVLKANGWFLVFGRRKTVNTFMIRKMIDYDHYLFVMKGCDRLRQRAPLLPSFRRG